MIQLPIRRVIFVEDVVAKLGQEITKQHRHILQTTVRFEAESYARKKLPEPNEHDLTPYVRTITGQYMAMKKDISIELQAGLQKFNAAVGVTPLNEKINSVKSEIQKEVDSLHNLEIDRNRINISNSYQAYRRYSWLILLFGLAEILVTSSVFMRLFSDILIVALILGAVVGLAQIYAAKMAMLTIREINDHHKQKLYYRLAFIAFAIISLVLGALRFFFAHKGAAAGVPFLILSPFTIAVLNMLPIIATALLVHYFFPSKAEMRELEQLEDINRQIKKCETRKGELAKEYDKRVAERVHALKIHGELHHCEKQLFEKIDAFYAEAIGRFIHENVTKRNDGAFPPCFKQPHEVLPSTTETELLLTEK